MRKRTPLALILLLGVAGILVGVLTAIKLPTSGRQMAASGVYQLPYSRLQYWALDLHRAGPLCWPVIRGGPYYGRERPGFWFWL